MRILLLSDIHGNWPGGGNDAAIVNVLYTGTGCACDAPVVQRIGPVVSMSNGFSFTGRTKEIDGLENLRNHLP